MGPTKSLTFSPRDLRVAMKQRVEVVESFGGVLKWDPFLEGIKLDAKIYGNFEGFPKKNIVHEVWVGNTS